MTRPPTTPTQTATHVRTWPSLAAVPALYPDARNRPNRGPFLYRAGKSWPLRSQPDTAGRIPLLAVGSNGYPRQLHDKLAGTPADLQGVPTIPAILRDFDVAWCPVRSRKGYVPVTLAARPGAVCLTWLQWLTPEQLNIVSATEGARYALVGGADLADSAQIASNLRRPETIYAWWFDAILVYNGAPSWLDVYERRIKQDIDVFESHLNSLPPGLHEVPRDPLTHAIGPEVMCEL